MIPLTGGRVRATTTTHRTAELYWLRMEFPSEPDPGEFPVAAYRSRRHFENLDDFLLIQSTEIAQLDNSRRARCDLRERGERVVQGEHGAVRLRSDNCGFVEVHLNFPIAAFVRSARTCGVHEDAAHHSGRHREKLGTLLRLYPGHSHQAQIDFMDQGSCLKCVTRAFVPHVAASHQTQFGVNMV